MPAFFFSLVIKILFLRALNLSDSHRCVSSIDVKPGLSRGLNYRAVLTETLPLLLFLLGPLFLGLLVNSHSLAILSHVLFFIVLNCLTSG
jgi:hypothetical protein